MGTLRSDFDLAGAVVNGVELAPGAVDPDTGEFIWDHSDLPEGGIVPDEWAVYPVEEVTP